MELKSLLLVFSVALLNDLVDSQVQCPPQGVVFIPDEDCTKYHVCNNGEANSLECPDGLYFSPEIEGCDFEINVPECIGGTRPPIGTTPTTSGSTTWPTIPNPSTTIATTLSTTWPTIPNPSTTTQQPPSGVLTNCGDKIVGNAGLIEYKLNQDVEENSRCAFIIRSLNHSAFIFTLEEHGFEDSPLIDGGAINIFSFGHEGHLDHAHLGPPNPLRQAYVSGSLVVVVFRTEGKIGTGFRLRFEGTGNWNYEFKGWEDNVISETSGSLKYPATGNYQDDLSAMFVISNNHKAIEFPSELHLDITSADLDKDCSSCYCDFLLIYSFFDNSLEPLQRICNGDNNIAFTTQGLYILFFKTDFSSTGTGFSLDWKIQQLGESF